MTGGVDPCLVECNLSAYHEANYLCAPKEPLPLPVVVITGFLGSGKTTLVQKILKLRSNLRISAIAHDLAQLNVDSTFLAGGVQQPMSLAAAISEKALRRADAPRADGDVTGLTGCACCPDFDGPLKAALVAALKQGVDEGCLDYLLLETSGAADPRRLVAALEQRFGALTRARLDRVVAVVDAEEAAASGERWLQLASGAIEQARSSEDVVQLAQLAAADVVLLNKTDLVSEEQKLASAALLQRLCPTANVLCCSFGNAPLAELLEIQADPIDATPAVSHEQTAVSWSVTPGLEPKLRPSMRSSSAVPSKPPSQHLASHRVIEWSCDSRPVYLARFQELVSLHLPLHLATVRRGKGVLWVAEDAEARWEWQCSGRLRFATTRDPSGFGGAQPSTGLVLIFAEPFSDAAAASLRKALEALVEPPLHLPGKIKEVEELLISGQPSFELLEPPRSARAGPSDDVVRFRLTGREEFHIPEDVDLAVPPYSVDLEKLNVELARQVSAAQGGHFLAVGTGVDKRSGRTVAGFLLPAALCSSPSKEELPSDVPSRPVLQEVIEVLRREARPALTRAFAHVQSCRCGQ